MNSLAGCVELGPDGSIPKPYKPVAVDVGKVLTKEITAPSRIVSPVMREKGLMMIHGPRGAGKTHVMVGLAWAMSTATNFLRWTVERPYRVLVFDGEMPEADL